MKLNDRGWDGGRFGVLGAYFALRDSNNELTPDRAPESVAGSPDPGPAETLPEYRLAPDHLFTQAISRGKARLEEMTTIGKVRYGDYPDRSSQTLSAITLVSGINDFSRIEQMKKRVKELTWDSSTHQPVSTDNGVAERSAV